MERIVGEVAAAIRFAALEAFRVAVEVAFSPSHFGECFGKDGHRSGEDLLS